MPRIWLQFIGSGGEWLTNKNNNFNNSYLSFCTFYTCLLWCAKQSECNVDKSKYLSLLRIVFQCQIFKETIESLVSREMARRYLQFDIKVRLFSYFIVIHVRHILGFLFSLFVCWEAQRRVSKLQLYFFTVIFWALEWKADAWNTSFVTFLWQ